MASFKVKSTITLKVDNKELWVLYNAVSHYHRLVSSNLEGCDDVELARIEAVHSFLDDATDQIV